ncbi:MAG: ABC transporter ATP-binding protein/permease, partial [Salinisphaera sp.]|nr:ABC transporter ATP-binding protein/permease [Salinisphaera sp.]
MSEPGVLNNRGFLLACLRPYRGRAAAVTAGAALAGIADSVSIGLLVPLLAAWQGNGGGDGPAALAVFGHFFHLLGIEPGLTGVVACVLAAIAVKNVLLLLTFAGIYRLSATVAANARGQLAGHLLHADSAFHDRHRASDLVDTCYNKTRALETVVQTGFHLIAQVLIGIALFALLFTLSWRLTLLALLLSLCGLLLVRWHNRSTAAAGSRLAAAETGLIASLSDAIHGLRLIRISAALPAALASLQTHNRGYARALRRGNFQAFLMMPATDLLGSLGIAALALLALALMEWTPAAALTVLLPFVYVLLRLVPLGRQLSHHRARIALFWPNLTELRRLLRDARAARCEDGSDPFPGLTREIRFENVSFRYDPDHPPALAQVSFSIPAGATTAIVGATGSGKSTIARLLLRLYEPQSGHILLDDRPLSAFCMASVYQRVG